jgi:hypothetical protein
MHTPGPWFLDRTFIPKPGYVAISATSHTALAQVVVHMLDDDGPLPSGVANAMLIASAPDLLQAVQLALNVLDATGAQDEANKARAAIAKATGA